MATKAKPTGRKRRSAKKPAAAPDGKATQTEETGTDEEAPDRFELGRRFLVELFEGREWVPRDEIGEKAEAADVSAAMLGRLKRDLGIRHRMMRGEDEAGRPRFFWALPEGGKGGRGAPRGAWAVRPGGRGAHGPAARLAVRVLRLRACGVGRR